MGDTIFVILLLTLVGFSESLECYSCSKVANPGVCNVTILCSDGQACYHNFSSGEHSVGCVNIQKCGSQTTNPAIVGRSLMSRSLTTCFECCSTDHCNSALCQHPEPKKCMDDETVDCAKLNSIFNICNDKAHAQIVCAKFCGLCVVDGNWTLWSSWSQCDVTCGNGHQTRTRTCTNPTPRNGGLDCVGDSVTTKSCHNDSPCPVHGGWSDLSHWGTCSVTCGMGQERRTRTCSNPPPSLAGNHCFGANTETQLCMPAACANGGWSSWTTWSTCSATCGGGIRSQSRSCTNPQPSPYGQYCVGSNDRVETCANNNCETNHCLTNPCVYGQCFEVRNDFLCSCNHGYEGRYCNMSASHCIPDPCINGTCVDMLNDFSCTCYHGFEGRHCNISNSPCKSNPCIHGQCYENGTGYYCACTAGFTGKLCNISNYYCKTNPCIHGTCSSGPSDYTCNCIDGYLGRNCDVTNATDCYDILQRKIGYTNGVYNVTLWRSKVVKEIYCDMETDLGGWTVFQNRFDGSVNFTRSFREYSNGFGNYTGEYWLGLEFIEEMTRQETTQLRIDLTAADNSKAHEIFQNFHLSSYPNFALNINRGTGTAGDTYGLLYHNGDSFYTYDRDNTYNCAHRALGGWWYNNCANANLNGKYFTPGTDHGDPGMYYYDFKAKDSLKSSRMMFRRT